jgi:hypothetical protein
LRPRVTCLCWAPCARGVCAGGSWRPFGAADCTNGRGMLAGCLVGPWAGWGPRAGLQRPPAHRPRPIGWCGGGGGCKGLREETETTRNPAGAGGTSPFPVRYAIKEQAGPALSVQKSRLRLVRLSVKSTGCLAGPWSGWGAWAGLQRPPAHRPRPIGWCGGGGGCKGHREETETTPNPAGAGGTSPFPVRYAIKEQAGPALSVQKSRCSLPSQIRPGYKSRSNYVAMPIAAMTVLRRQSNRGGYAPTDLSGCL